MNDLQLLTIKSRYRTTDGANGLDENESDWLNLVELLSSINNRYQMNLVNKIEETWT